MFRITFVPTTTYNTMCLPQYTQSIPLNGSIGNATLADAQLMYFLHTTFGVAFLEETANTYGVSPEVVEPVSITRLENKGAHYTLYSYPVWRVNYQDLEKCHIRHLFSSYGEIVLDTPVNTLIAAYRGALIHRNSLDIKAVRTTNEYLIEPQFSGEAALNEIGLNNIVHRCGNEFEVRRDV